VGNIRSTNGTPGNPTQTIYVVRGQGHEYLSQRRCRRHMGGQSWSTGPILPNHSIRPRTGMLLH